VHASSRTANEDGNEEAHDESVRTVIFSRQKHPLGIKVKGGSDHGIPLVITQVNPNSPAELVRFARACLCVCVYAVPVCVCTAQMR
jgi:hypothetical protein